MVKVETLAAFAHNSYVFSELYHIFNCHASQHASRSGQQQWQTSRAVKSPIW